MAKIAIYEGFGRRGRKARKSGKRRAHKRTSHKRARKSHGSKARTPQAMKFKRAISECGKKQLPAGTTIRAAQKALGKCVRAFYK